MYQSKEGGKTHIPLNISARILASSSPKLVKTLGWKYANLCGQQAVDDLSVNHGLQISKKKLQAVNETLGSVLADKENKWTTLIRF